LVGNYFARWYRYTIKVIKAEQQAIEEELFETQAEVEKQALELMSAKPTLSPSTSPSVPPTALPSALPTPLPVAPPTLSPTASPSISPTPLPVASPTPSPTAGPSVRPSPAPSQSPSASPSEVPSVKPSRSRPTRSLSSAEEESRHQGQGAEERPEATQRRSMTDIKPGSPAAIAAAANLLAKYHDDIATKGKSMSCSFVAFSLLFMNPLHNGS
jgi:hypothetical protein